MVVRVTKHIFNEYLKTVKDYALADTVALLLNSFFGRLTKGNKGFQSGFPTAETIKKDTGNKKTQQNKADEKPTVEGEITAIPSQLLPQQVTVQPLNVSHHIMWKQIRDKVATKYDYQLPNLIPGGIFSLPTLRGLCQRVGIHLLARKYTLTENSFSPAHIIGLFPIVKHSAPESRDGLHFFELGKSFMAEGRLDKAFEYLNAALEFFTQVYGMYQFRLAIEILGPMHPDVGECYTNLAKVLNSAGDYQQAVIYQQKATIMSERFVPRCDNTLTQYLGYTG